MFKESIQKMFKREPEKIEKPGAEVIRVDDYREEFTPSMKTRLDEYRKRLIDEELSEEERKDYLALQEMEKGIENKPLTPAEDQEWLNLSRAQSRGKEGDWTAEKSNRFLELNDRRDKAKKAAR